MCVLACDAFKTTVDPLLLIIMVDFYGFLGHTFGPFWQPLILASVCK